MRSTMVPPGLLVGAALALAVKMVDGARFIPPTFNRARAGDPSNPWAFYNVTIFAANEGYGASYIRFDVQNNDAGVTSGMDFSTSCSATAFPSDPVNGGTTPSNFENGGVQGGCANTNVTWTWDGNTLQTTYDYDSGTSDQNGHEYICTVFGSAFTNETTLTTKTSECGCVKVAERIPITSAYAIC